MELRAFELRRDGRRLSGTAVRYGDVAVMPWGGERFSPGAFQPLGDVTLNLAHDRGRPIARTGGGGLTLQDDGEALRIVADLPASREADDALVLVKANVLRGLSMEFRAVRERLEDGVRVIDQALLGAVSIVDTPAYPGSEVEARQRGRGRGGRGRGGRRSWIRGNVRYGIKVHCTCLAGNCNKVIFRPAALELLEDDDVLAHVGRTTESIGSTRGSTLRITQTPDRMDFEIDAAARNSTAGKQLQDLQRAGVDVYGRPIVDEAVSEFTDQGGVRTYSRASLRGILIKPIAGPDDLREGWEPLTFDGDLPDVEPRRRPRIWL